MPAREVPERFQVALSFSGAEREFVRSIAEAIERRLGWASVFFDEWFEFYVGGHDADAKLQRIYGTGCELAVVCVSATYGSKAWTRAEHEAIRGRLMQARAEQDPRQPDRVFPIRVGDGNVDGIPFNAIAPDVRERTPEQVAELIADRLQFVMASAPSAASTKTAVGRETTVGPSPLSLSTARRVSPPTPVYLSAEIRSLSEQLERARARKQHLCEAGITTDEVDREILQLRRQLREGGQLRAGDSLGDGRYLLVTQLGRGGFAVVWEAWDRMEQRRVAIKVLHQHLAGDPQRRERFFRGARVMMELKHPAVVCVYDPRGEDDAFFYFVMELVPGGNLRDAVLGKRVEARHRLSVILQVGEALVEAHRKQLIHRDIKPANVLLDENGNAKLTDFDLVGAQDTTGGTRTGTLGTFVYAAPECLDKPYEATARADVFGLGMTAIFCMSGHDLSMATFRDPAVTVVQLECLVAVRNVLVRAVAWEPDLRFPDAAAMLEALRGAIGDTSQSVTADDIGAAQTPIVIEALTPAVESSGPRGSAPIGGVDSMPEAPERPRWAVASGRDHHGIWAAFQVNRVRQRMRWIPPGTFRMGSPETEWGRWNNEGPQHEVTLHRGFWFGETPVTQLLWRAVMGMNSSRFVGEWRLSGERPVESVSWDDCHAFLGRLNAEISGLAARLPSETEWERACRAGTSGPTWASKLSQGVDAHELEAIAWYGENSGGMPNQVGRKAANPYGLHDILGNVFEWCQDPAERVVARYSREFELPEHSSHRMIRGGSWYSRARRVRSASRYACARDFRGDSVGFRLAAS